MNTTKHNEIAWDNEVKIKNKWTIPVTSEEVRLAREGRFALFLTPTKPVPREWIGNLRGKDVLCLASGGGQQGPILSAFGANVTVFDNSKEQLARDEMVSKRDNLDIKLEKGDMKNLSIFEDESFDFIFHPVSNCFIDDIALVWKECFRILKKSGVLISGFVNPIMYLFDSSGLEDKDNLVVTNTVPYSDTEQLPKEQLKKMIEKREPLEFGHSLQSQIGGQTDVGFAICGFYEDKFIDRLLDKYIDTFIATKAVKF